MKRTMNYTLALENATLCGRLMHNGFYKKASEVAAATIAEGLKVPETPGQALVYQSLVNAKEFNPHLVPGSLEVGLLRSW